MTKQAGSSNDVRPQWFSRPEVVTDMRNRRDIAIGSRADHIQNLRLKAYSACQVVPKSPSNNAVVNPIFIDESRPSTGYANLRCRLLGVRSACKKKNDEYDKAQALSQPR
jgi:hypothetical protein